MGKKVRVAHAAVKATVAVKGLKRKCEEEPRTKEVEKVVAEANDMAEAAKDTSATFEARTTPHNAPKKQKSEDEPPTKEVVAAQADFEKAGTSVPAMKIVLKKRMSEEKPPIKKANGLSEAVKEPSFSSPKATDASVSKATPTCEASKLQALLGVPGRVVHD